MNIEEQVARRFVDAISAEFTKLSPVGDMTLTEWYVTSDSRRFDPNRLDMIPQNRVFVVWVYCEGSSFQLSLIWDGLEQSVTAYDRSKKPEVMIGEFRRTPFMNMPGYGSLEAAVAACRKEVEEYLRKDGSRPHL